jgi:cell division protein FtsI/penicillin-binding protein 2
MRRSSARWWSFLLAVLLAVAPAIDLHAQSKKKKRRRAAPRYTVPSVGNPTANDVEAGEDPAVRALAVQALGNWNGSVVVSEADTGRILTIVNQPQALSSGFKPCSTIKVAVGLGALEEGLITGDTKIKLSRREEMDLTEAMARSNNPFFEILGKKMGFAKVSAYARLLGFGELAGYLIDGEYPGSFPMEPPVNGGVGRMSSFGEGIKVTPLQLAALMGAFANGGRLYYLQYPRAPQELEGFRPRVKRHLPIQRWLPELRAGMEAAVVYGTAKVSTASFSEGQMLGKTGTCGEDKAKLGWFASYGELPDGKKVSVVVLLRGGRSFSGSKAAQIAAEIYKGLADSQQFAGTAPRGATGASASPANDH